MLEDATIKREINKLINEYSNIRMKFEEYKEKYPKYLEGNDNYIGIIGEYWATIFLEQEKKGAIEEFLKMKKKSSGEMCSRKYSKSNEWYDFIANLREGKVEFISVKTITSENQQGKSGKIKYPSFKDEPKCKYILSVIVVKLDEDLIPEQLLYINDMGSSLKDCKGKYCDYSSHWQKGRNSLVFKYYKNEGFDEIFSSKIWRWEDGEFVRKRPL